MSVIGYSPGGQDELLGMYGHEGRFGSRVFEKQDWGYYTRGKNDEVYMVVFNQPYSERLIVKTPKGITVEKATLLTTGEDITVVETTRNEYNVSVPKKNPGEPYVIQLKVRAAKGTKSIYRDALT